MKLLPLDWAVVAVYLGGIVALGVWAGRRDRDTDDYFTAGRGLPGWVVGLSIMGTCISSVTYVAYPGKALVGDWQYLVQGLTLPIVLAAGGFMAAGFYRRHVKTSVNEYLEQRFGPGVRLFSFVFLLISEITRVGSVLYLFSLVVHTVTGLSIAAVIIGIGALTAAYTVLGGIRGVIFTDVVQSVALMAAGVTTVAVASSLVPGGLGAVLTEAYAGGKFKLFDFSPTLARDGFWVLMLSGLVNYFYFLTGNQNQVQRYQCASSDREALKATLLGSLLSVPVWALFLLAGTCLFVLYQHHPDPAVTALLAAQDGDKVFPHFIVTGLPAGVSGLLLAGLFAAAMSSLDSSMNAASTLTLTDLYRRFFRPELEPARGLLIARGLTLVWGGLGIGLALLMVQVEVFLTFYFKIVSLVIGAMTGVFFLALVAKRAHARGVLAGIGAGLVTTGWGALSMLGVFTGDLAGWKFPWHPIMAGVVTTAVVIVVGWAASLILPPGENRGHKCSDRNINRTI